MSKALLQRDTTRHSSPQNRSLRLFGSCKHRGAAKLRAQNIKGMMKTHVFTHSNVLDLELRDGRRESPTTTVDVHGVQYGGSSHVVREHIHQEVDVAELRG